MFKALQNVAPSQLADRELFDFESLKTERTDDERLFEGDNIQVGVADKLATIGLPTNPEVQTFNPKFAKDKDSKDNKIPVINPVL